MAREGRVDLVARPKGGRSGVGRYAVALAGELRRCGYDVVETPTFGVPRPVLRRVGSAFGLDVEAFLASYPVSVARRPDALLHVTAQTFATLLWRQPGGVVTVHDLFAADQTAGPRGVVVRLFDAAGRLALRRADAVITGSEATARICRARGLAPGGRVAACLYGVDHAVFRPTLVPDAFRRRLGIPDGAPILLYVGTEAPRKRVEVLLHALAGLRRRGWRDAVLVKVGAPHYAEQRGRLRALAGALDVAAQVRWVDGVTEEQLVWLYSAATLYVSASGREGFGLPVLEAMACGCPVAVSAIAPHQEIVGAAGTLLPVEETGDWAGRLAALLADTERRRASAHAAVDRAAAFTWRRTARQTIAVYEAPRGSAR